MKRAASVQLGGWAALIRPVLPNTDRRESPAPPSRKRALRKTHGVLALECLGYTETAFQEAFTLADLSEAALVAVFVPVAAEKADGFAGFRETAMKTNFLADRLKTMTLPEPDTVVNDLDRYLQKKERTDKPDAEIKKIDRFIDEIVYDLTTSPTKKP